MILFESYVPSILGISASVLWTKSSKIGINNSSDILHTESVRSKITCAILCTNNVQCKSYQYEISIKLCTMLSKPHQSEPFTDSSETQHFGTQHIIGKQHIIGTQHIIGKAKASNTL